MIFVTILLSQTTELSSESLASTAYDFTTGTFTSQQIKQGPGGHPTLCGTGSKFVALSHTMLGEEVWT